MKHLLRAIMLLPLYADAGGGLRPGTPDRFFEVIGFIIFMAVLISLFRK